MTELPNGDFQYVPDGFDESRERPELDRSDQLSRLAELIDLMDTYVSLWSVVSGVSNAAHLSGVGDDMAATWVAYREEMRSL